MRIGFLGKGGSGKSTISAAFASYLAQNGKNTLLIDADINVHTHDLVGIEKEELTPIGENGEVIKNYLRGSRTDIENIPFLSSIPPSEESNFLTLDEKNPLLKQLSQKNKDNLRFMCIGGYTESEIGFTCYHGKTDNFILLLSHLMDQKDDYVVVDSVTGIDNVGTMLIHSYDINIFVVEPTQKSLEVYKDFLTSVQKMNLQTHIFVIGNKVSSDEDREFLQNHVGEENILGFVEKSKHMKYFDRGRKEAFQDFIDENSENFESVLERIQGKQRNMNEYTKKVKENFLSGVNSFYNEHYGISFPDFIDIESCDYKKLYK